MQRTYLRTAKAQCKAKMKTLQANGKPTHCLDTFRIVTTDAKGKVIKMRCLNGHKVKGDAAKLNYRGFSHGHK